MLDPFYTHDGWHWTRQCDGAVVVQLRDAHDNVKCEHRMTAEEWSSVVASMSLRGESGYRFYTAFAFHNEREP